MNKTKICITCKKRKARSMFYPRNKGKGWISAQCKPCTNASRRLRKEKELGRKMKPGATCYSAAELAKLKKLYLSGIPYNTLMKQFPNRSKHALESKLSEMGIASRKSYMLKRQTGIEITIEQFLRAKGIAYQSQQLISRMCVDFLIKENIVIEVMGSYCHSDPKLYPKGPKYKLQKINVARDKIRKEVLLSLGYNIIYLWEYDIEHNFEALQKELHVVLNSDIWDNNQPISVEVLRDDTEITRLIAKGSLAS